MAEDDVQGGGNPAAGWYPSPTEPGLQRYWDGTQWTEHTAPLSGAATYGSEAYQEPQQWGQQPPAYGGSPYGVGYQPPPEPWLWQSIVATILCCLPLGIPGIVFAAKSQSAAAAGDYAGAAAHAKTARTWTLVAVGTGLVFVVGYIMLAVFGMISFMQF